MKKKKIKILNISLVVLIVFVVLLISASGVFLIIDRAAAQEAYRGVTINGIDFGGESYDKIRESLTEKVNDFNSQKIIIELKGEESAANPQELGINIDIDKTIEEISKIKDEKTTFQKIKILFNGVEISVQTSIDETTFFDYLENHFTFSEKEAQNADVVLTKSGFELIESENSQKIDRDYLLSELTKKAQNLNTQKLNIVVNSKEPQILDEEAKLVLESIKSKLKKPIYLLNGEEENKVEVENLENWIAFKTEIREGKLKLVTDLNEHTVKAYLKNIFTNDKQEAQNARLSYDPETKKAFVVSPGKPGYGFATLDNILRIKEGWLQNDEEKINLVSGSVEPNISARSIEEFNITHLVGSGSTNFAGSPPSRVFNVNVAAEKFDGLVIKRGEEFSFNKNLGPVDARNGFISAMVILGNVIKPSMGGGVCQVSTTAFQAAVKTGFQVTDRSGHSFALSYYGEPGFDATIYLPKPDLKFINNTESDILIQTKIEGTVLTFEYYGQDDNRRVELEGPYKVEQNPDGSFYTLLKQRVFINEEQIESNKFTTFYKPRSAFKTEKELEEEAKKKEEEEKKKQEEEEAAKQQESEQNPPAEQPAPEPVPEAPTENPPI